MKREVKTLSEEERLCWLQLARSENIGPATFYNLLYTYHSAQEALTHLPALIHQKNHKRPIRIAQRAHIERELKAASALNIRFIALCEPDYPSLLRKIPAPPPLLAVRGDPTLFTKTSIGIVGARNASTGGKKIAQHFAHSLGAAGFTIVSGFARGVDACAHQASLTTGTIAVMAGGVDHIYPPEHNRLYQDILDKGGVFISEMPLGWVPRHADFPRRNRLIAGLSLGLLVVEAALRSGSLITARLAGEAGRMVFSIPGSPLDPRAAGTNNLIKEGGLLATSPDDIIETLLPLIPTSTPLYTTPNTPLPSDRISFIRNEKDHKTVLNALSSTPIDQETLSLRCGIPLHRLHLALIELDLSGQLIRHHNGTLSRRQTF
ncbi:DNA-processing protein DprA [Bartonella sp. DGB2]|uniref:DNA-processing protein DprA n=1 Tax=Bartonella sp. DGB2 TaxID=3388426 RepID=UPI00398FE955